MIEGVGVAAAGALALGVDVRGRCVARAVAVGDEVARAERDPLGSTSQSAGAQSALIASAVASPLRLTSARVGVTTIVAIGVDDGGTAV